MGLGEIMARAQMLKTEELAHPLRPLPLHDLILGYAKKGQFVLRQIYPAEGRVLLHIAQNIGQLKGHAERHGVIARTGIATTENLDADQADRAGHAVAVFFSSSAKSG